MMLSMWRAGKAHRLNLGAKHRSTEGRGVGHLMGIYKEPEMSGRIRVLIRVRGPRPAQNNPENISVGYGRLPVYVNELL